MLKKPQKMVYHYCCFFYRPNDLETVKHFNGIVGKHLPSEKQRVNFLTAGGIKFTYPLQRLGKREVDRH